MDSTPTDTKNIACDLSVRGYCVDANGVAGRITCHTRTMHTTQHCQWDWMLLCDTMGLEYIFIDSSIPRLEGTTVIM